MVTSASCCPPVCTEQRACSTADTVQFQCGCSVPSEALSCSRSPRGPPAHHPIPSPSHAHCILPCCCCLPQLNVFTFNLSLVIDCLPSCSSQHDCERLSSVRKKEGSEAEGTRANNGNRRKPNTAHCTLTQNRADTSHEHQPTPAPRLHPHHIIGCSS